jgi:RNA polymerase sigma factor (sigma-70 family)
MRRLRRAALGCDNGAMTDGHLLECFLTRKGEEEAFEVLVRRYGPLVLSVCRRVLRNYHDAEDAFQATFLVLARKAASIARPERLANWLYGVAYHTALKARDSAMKRRAKEAQWRPPAGPEDLPAGLGTDWQLFLDQELSRLPDRYREAVVLCDLQGKTRREAARQLGVPEGTLSGRLTTARRMLARRLARQGLVLGAGSLATVLAQAQAGARVPVALALSTARAATFFAAGQAATPGAVSSQVAALTKGVLQSMSATKFTITTIVFLAACACAVLAVSALRPVRAAVVAVRTPKAKESPVQKERNKFAGTWKYVSGELGGRQVPAQALPTDTLVFDAAGNWKQMAGNQPQSAGTTDIRLTTRPRSMTATVTRGEGTGLVILAVYEFLDGDTYRVCSFPAEKGRPKNFVTRPRDGRSLFIMKRVKP